MEAIMTSAGTERKTRGSHGEICQKSRARLQIWRPRAGADYGNVDDRPGSAPAQNLLLR
jgi:hypothetical protein